MSRLRIALAVVALAAAIFAALLASDLRSWQDGIRNGDARYFQNPASATWDTPTVLPFHLARGVLGISDQIAFRRAAQTFVAVHTLGKRLRQRLFGIAGPRRPRDRPDQARRGRRPFHATPPPTTCSESWRPRTRRREARRRPRRSTGPSPTSSRRCSSTRRTRTRSSTSSGSSASSWRTARATGTPRPRARPRGGTRRRRGAWQGLLVITSASNGALTYRSNH